MTEYESNLDVNNGNDNNNDSYIGDSAASRHVRLRGLPYSASERDIKDFLEGLTVQKVTIVNGRDGRPSGECYVELDSKESADRALEYDRRLMSKRYIEVFTVNDKDLANLQARGLMEDDGSVVRLRGLPFSASEKEVKEFFEGLDCEQVLIGRTGSRPSGEAYVRLGSKDQAVRAMELNKKTMGTRYIEIFRSTFEEMERQRNGEGRSRGGPVPRGSGPPSLLSFGYGDSQPVDPYYESSYSPYAARGRPAIPPRPAPYRVPARGRPEYDARPQRDYATPFPRVYMRGIPFDADAAEIDHFFHPLRLLTIRIGYNDMGRPSGDAYVEFETMNEAADALRRNKEHMGRRYVELYPSEDMPSTMRYISWKVIQERAPQPRVAYPPRPVAAAVPPAAASAYDPVAAAYEQGYERAAYEYAAGAGYDTSAYASAATAPAYAGYATAYEGYTAAPAATGYEGYSATTASTAGYAPPPPARGAAPRPAPVPHPSAPVPNPASAPIRPSYY